MLRRGIIKDLTVNSFFSTIIVILFGAGLLSFTFLSDLHYPISESYRGFASQQKKSFIDNTFKNENTKKIKLINRMGSYRFEKSFDQWVMIDETETQINRKLPVKSEVIQTFFEFIPQISVIDKIHYNEVNYKSYSFHAPLYSLSFTDKNNETFTLKLGLNNTLDDSNYIFHSQLQKIFKVRPIKNSFLKLTQEDIVNPQIITIDEKKVIAIELKRNNKIYSNLQKEEKNWLNSRNQKIETQRLVSALNYLNQIKSSHVISEFNFQSLNIKGRKSPPPPIVTLTLKHLNNESIIFKIHQPMRDMNSLNIKMKSNLIIESSLHNAFFIIEKKALQIINNLEEQKLKSLDLKKIIY